MNATTKTIGLTERIDRVDALLAQAAGVTACIAAASRGDVPDSAIENASWAVRDLLEEAKRHNAAVYSFAAAAVQERAA